MTTEILEQPAYETIKLPTRRFITDALHYLPASVLPALLSVIAVTVFTRVFSSSEYGIYSLVLAITGPLATLLIEWAAQPIGRFYAEYKRQNRGEEYRQIVATIAVLVGTVIVLLSILVATGFILINGAIPQPLVFSGAAVVVLTQSLTSIVMPILPASLRRGPYRAAIVASAGLSVGLALILIFVFGANIAWLLWGQALASAITLPYIYRSAGIHLTRFSRTWTPQIADTSRRFVHYGAPMMLWMFASGLLAVGDRYVIQLFHGSTAVGVYSVNYNLVTMAIGFINGPMMTAAFPILMHQWANKQFETARRTLAQMTDIYFVLALGLVGGIAVINRPLVDVLLGPDFRAGYVIHLPVAAGAVLWGASILGHKSMEFAERTTLMVWNILIAAGINLGLNFVFVPRFGYVAAAYATLVGYGVYVLLIWWQARGLVPWDIPYFRVLLIASVAVVSWAIGEAAMQITDISILKLVVGASGFACAYGLLNLVLHYPKISLATLRRTIR